MLCPLKHVLENNHPLLMKIAIDSIVALTSSNLD
jgi:hypothetical protein